MKRTKQSIIDALRLENAKLLKDIKSIERNYESRVERLNRELVASKSVSVVYFSALSVAISDERFAEIRKNAALMKNAILIGESICRG